jgi:hypothetical protein
MNDLRRGRPCSEGIQSQLARTSLYATKRRLRLIAGQVNLLAPAFFERSTT